MSEATARCGDELLAWRCVHCDQWIKEFGPIDRSECPGEYGEVTTVIGKDDSND